jgi:spore maturation protein CgeB
VKPSIAFFGSSLISAYWNGAATYYRGIIRSLAVRGFQISFYEPDAYERQKHRDIPDPPWARVVVYPPTQTGAEAAIREATGNDILVKTSGVGVLDEWLDQAVLEASRPYARSIFWDVDAPATLDRLAGNPQDPFHRLVGQYDMVLTYGGGEPVVSGNLSVGAKACVPVYNALDPTTHFQVAPDQRFAAALGLLANRLPDREARVDAFFFAASAQCSDKRFLLGGNGWADKVRPPNVNYVGHVYTRDHNAFNCTPRLLLNISRDSMARFGYSPATRVFEAAGAGACLITDAWEGISEFLEPEHEVLVASNGQEVANYVAGIGADEAARIGKAAQQRVLAEHTYDHRGAQLDALLDAGVVA